MLDNAIHQLHVEKLVGGTNTGIVKGEDGKDYEVDLRAKTYRDPAGLVWDFLEVRKLDFVNSRTPRWGAPTPRYIVYTQTHTRIYIYQGVRAPASVSSLEVALCCEGDADMHDSDDLQ